MNKTNNEFLNISCDLIPVVLDICESSEQDVKQFAVGISQYIFNPENEDETLSDFKNGSFQRYIDNLKIQGFRNNIPVKYIAFFSTIIKSFKNCDIPIKEVLFRDSPDEFWVIANSYSEKESQRFYNFAFANWGDIISHCCVLFIGEDQLNREQMPSDLLSIIRFK